eukprot:3932532-Rhodomonas_salina.1
MGTQFTRNSYCSLDPAHTVQLVEALANRCDLSLRFAFGVKFGPCESVTQCECCLGFKTDPDGNAEIPWEPGTRVPLHCTTRDKIWVVLRIRVPGYPGIQAAIPEGSTPGYAYRARSIDAMDAFSGSVIWTDSLATFGGSGRCQRSKEFRPLQYPSSTNKWNPSEIKFFASETFKGSESFEPIFGRCKRADWQYKKAVSFVPVSWTRAMGVVTHGMAAGGKCLAAGLENVAAGRFLLLQNFATQGRNS